MRLDDDLKYFESSEFKEILARYESAHNAGESIYMDADDMTDVAEYFSMVMHDDERANEVIDQALNLHPDAVDPQIFRARQFLINDDLETAQQLCDAISDQQHREVFFLRAELMVRKERVEEAVTMLSVLAQDIEEDKDYFLYDSAYIFIDYDFYEEALSFACQLSLMAPEWYKTWHVLADIFLGMQRYNDALVNIQKMLDVDPFYAETWNWSAEAYCGLQQYDEAMSSTDYALAIDPENMRAMQLKAWLLLQQGDNEGSHQIYTKLEELMPEEYQHWFYDTFALWNMERKEEALKTIERAEELVTEENNLFGIYSMHAQMLSVNGRLDEALDYVDKAELLYTYDEDFGDINIFRSRIYAENGQPQMAVEYILKAMGNDSVAEDILLFNGAVVLFENSYWELSFELFKVVEQQTDNDKLCGECMAYQAYCAMMMEDSEQTLDYLQRALSNGEDKLRDLFCDEFPNVQPAEYYDYYYYRVNGHWPNTPMGETR